MHDISQHIGLIGVILASVKVFGWLAKRIGQPAVLIAAGTGLSEVVTSLESRIKGRDDIASGNVIGSNVFNILGINGG